MTQTSCVSTIIPSSVVRDERNGTVPVLVRAALDQDVPFMHVVKTDVTLVQASMAALI